MCGFERRIREVEANTAMRTSCMESVSMTRALSLKNATSCRKRCPFPGFRAYPVLLSSVTGQ